MGRPLERPPRPGPMPGEAWQPPPQPPPRPPARRRAWWLLAVPALLGVGGAGGFVLGVWLELPPNPAAIRANPEPPPELTASTADLAGELATLRRMVAEQEARLDQVLRARAAAEQQLAELQQQPMPVPAPAAPTRGRPGAPPPAAAPAPASGPAQATPAAQPAPRRGPRVLVSFPAGSTQGQEAAQAVGATLREAGTEGVELRGLLGASPSGMRAVRFFHEQDAAAAARLAGRLGRGWAIQDFRGMDPQPPPQTLEVWVPDR